MASVQEVKGEMMPRTKEVIVLYTDDGIGNSIGEIVGEVVRCKDCEYKDGDICDYSAVYVHPNGFCNWGKRRKE